MAGTPAYLTEEGAAERERLEEMGWQEGMAAARQVVEQGLEEGTALAWARKAPGWVGKELARTEGRAERGLAVRWTAGKRPRRYLRRQPWRKAGLAAAWAMQVREGPEQP
jgi:hypothetical protein